MHALQPRCLHVSFTVFVGVAVALAAVVVAGSARSAGSESALIAFTRYDGIYVMRTDGRGVRPVRRGGVSAGAVGLDWSPDGSRIAFVSPAVGDPTNGIWVMAADGTDLVRVAKVSDFVHGYMSGPTWSPDGRMIAFTASSGDDRDIWIAKADGGRIRRLASTPGLWEYELDWSPNGRRIAFTGIGGYFSRLYAMNADGSNRRILTPGFSFEASGPDWSPDGGRIAITHRDGSATPIDMEIWVVDPRNGSRDRLSPESSISDRDPTWSPDGRKIALLRGPDKWTNCLNCPTVKNSSTEIYVMNADGTDITRLTHNKTGEGFPAWQPLVRR